MESTSVNKAVALAKASHKGRVKGVKKHLNPTINALRQITEGKTPDQLYTQYSPIFIKKDTASIGDVFKKETSLLTNLTQISFLATDNPVICMGEDFKNIQNFKKYHDWPLTDSLICIGYNSIHSMDDRHDKIFCMDIPAFLHSFKHTDQLKDLMNEMAVRLSSEWNAKYADEDMIGKRLYNEESLLLDFRKSQYSKKVTELVLAGTTFNHMHHKQHSYKNVTCDMKDIFFQIRYQGNFDPKPKRGQWVMNKEDWFKLFDSDEFNSFYMDLWNYCGGLPAEYSERIETYATSYCPINNTQLITNTTESD